MGMWRGGGPTVSQSDLHQENHPKYLTLKYFDSLRVIIFLVKSRSDALKWSPGPLACLCLSECVLRNAPQQCASWRRVPVELLGRFAQRGLPPTPRGKAPVTQQLYGVQDGRTGEDRRACSEEPSGFWLKVTWRKLVCMILFWELERLIHDPWWLQPSTRCREGKRTALFVKVAKYLKL